SFKTEFIALGDIFKAVLTGNFEALPGIIANAAKEGKKNFGNLTTDLANDWKNLMVGIEKVSNDALANVTSRKKLEFIKENVDASAIKDAVSDAVVEGLKEGTGKAKWEDSLEAYELKQKIASQSDLFKGTDLNIELAKANAGGESYL